MIETKQDVTDGTDDKQIDAIIVDDDSSRVYILQGKFIGEGTVDAGSPRSWSNVACPGNKSESHCSQTFVLVGWAESYRASSITSGQART